MIVQHLRNKVEWMGNLIFSDMFPQSDEWRRLDNMCGSIILAVLLVCAVFLIYSIVTDPLGEHDIMLALAVTAGFIALEQDKRKER